MNLPTITELRARAGITDNSKDAQLQSAYDLAFALIEDYLDRKLKLATYSEKFLDVRGFLLTKAWPVVSVDKLDTVAVTGFDSTYSDFEKGMLKITQRPVTVEYQGGYAPADFPEALVTAINLLFDYLWASIPGFATAGGVTAGSGDVKRFSINGVTMEYFEDKSASGESAGLSGWRSANMPEWITMLIDRYRRESVIGIG
jgi:hypothetical protein